MADSFVRRLFTGGLIAVATSLAASGPLGAAAAPAQSSTGVVPNWGDLETWTRVIQSTRESEMGLGLQLSGPGGATLVSFAGRLDTRAPNIPPKEISVLAAPGLMANPNTRRHPTLRFTIDEGLKSAALIDATGSLTVDDPAPGAVINSAAAQIKTADFIKLCEAKTIVANVFGSDAPIRLDQIKALRALAERLHLPLPKPTPAAAPAPPAAPDAPAPPVKPAANPDPD